ncbi:MAG: sodium:alanine symporter family protein [Gemmatimonadales bacterium]
MDQFERFIEFLNDLVWSFGIPAGAEVIPIVVICLLGTGIYLTLRLSFIQVRRLAHGFAVTSGKYDDPNEPGDVSHFQALTTALSATVGIGNIAGVAIAIHWGGPGALFWMWMTAFLGMATKYTEVTLAQRFRNVQDTDAESVRGTVSGGPMYYIERGLGPKWKPLAVFFAVMLGFTAFLTGNAVQANTVADTMSTEFGIPVWITGLVTALLVSAVILGGIRRIGKVTAVLAPSMAAVYVAGAMVIIALNIDQLIPAFALIFREAFNPTAGIAGTGVGAVLVTMMWGVKRGLFSNEAGQGSAPIAHAAAKTDEPVSEGVVALLEPFIDTIIIVTMTALVIIMTGVWNERIPTELAMAGGDGSFVGADATGQDQDERELSLVTVTDGAQQGDARFAWHEVEVERLYVDSAMTRPFTGVIQPNAGYAVAADGQRYSTLFGDAVESGAPLTMLGFQRGLPGDWGRFIVLVSVLLFAVSTAISWSYYGDRCANYLFGPNAILPYKLVFVGMHFFGAVVSLNVVWTMGDIALGIVILPNLLALVILAPRIVQETQSYFERQPWLENYEVHRRLNEERRRRHDG